MTKNVFGSIRSVGASCCILFSLAACGGDLSRGDARRQISQKLQLPAIQTTRIPRLALIRASSAGGSGFMPAITVCQDLGVQWSNVRYAMEALERKGLVSLGRETRRAGSCTYEYAVISLTPEGQSYQVGEANNGYNVRTHTLAFGEVTGIRVIKELKVAEAHYTMTTQDVTPFAGEVSLDPQQRSAAFQLFDDGWRIE